MTIKFSDVVSKADIIKISTLLLVSVVCWGWVWYEYQKPILPEGLDQDYFNFEKTEEEPIEEPADGF